MNFRILKILILIILIIFVLSIFAVETNRYVPSDENSVRLLKLNISNDKTVYHSSEEMQLTSTIETDIKIENLTIMVYGIKDSRGNYRVNEERTLNLDPPGKIETFTFRMPSCYGCAGISPGDYEIMMELLHNEELITNSSITVRLEK